MVLISTTCYACACREILGTCPCSCPCERLTNDRYRAACIDALGSSTDSHRRARLITVHTRPVVLLSLRVFTGNGTSAPMVTVRVLQVASSSQAFPIDYRALMVNQL